MSAWGPGKYQCFQCLSMAAAVTVSLSSALEARIRALGMSAWGPGKYQCFQYWSMAAAVTVFVVCTQRGTY
jgi:hypothetical protein